MPFQNKIKFASVAMVLAFALSHPLSSAAEEDKLRPLLIDAGYTEIPINKLTTGHEIVHVSLNGEMGLFVIDSGASVTVIHRGSADKFSLTVSEAKKTGTGAGGKLAISQAPIDGISLAGLELDLEIVHVTDLSYVVDALAAAAATEVDGVVGQDILTRFGGIIDVRGGRLFLHVPEEE